MPSLPAIYRRQRLCASRRGALALMACCLFASPVQAEKLYRFQDANGNMLLTNQVAAGGKKPLQAADKR